MTSYAMIGNDEFHTAMELPWKLSFLSLMRPVVRDELAMDFSYSFSRALPGFLRKHWAALHDCTIIDPFRLGWLLDLLWEVRLGEGDIVECGTFRGGSGILMSLA